MNMQQLREAFAAWRYRQTVNAVDIMWLLTDPTPITEAGLRELGYTQSLAFSSLWLSRPMPTIENKGNGKWELNGVTGCIKSMGQLRLLLLSVGE